MGRRRYGYNDQYHGRQRKSPFLKGLVIFLAILLLLGVAFLIYVSARYLEYTDEGTKLNLPWLQTQSAPPERPGGAELIIDGMPEDDPDGTPEPVSQPIRSLEVTAAAVADGSARDLAAQAGADALLVQVKDEEGDLAWQSALELAQEDMNGRAEFNEGVRALAREDQLHLTARLTGFQDLWTSVYVRDMAILGRTGKLWYDSDGISWISLTDEAARAYVTNLCLELAELGFDEILLEHSGYPDNGHVERIPFQDNYPEQGREVAERAFLAELSGKLAGAGTVLSVQVQPGEPDTAAVSGVTPAALTAISGRVWLPEETDPAAWVQAMVQAGMADGADRLVAAEPLPVGASWTGSRLLTS